jgi:hypothetical protein
MLDRSRWLQTKGGGLIATCMVTPCGFMQEF